MTPDSVSLQPDPRPVAGNQGAGRPVTLWPARTGCKRCPQSPERGGDDGAVRLASRSDTRSSSRAIWLSIVACA
ncbi:hypothetical protein CD178_00747 [Komagataeibacter saccharivorans]|uniref:Uncharacterized protein n=1 Tax=Komagataeibacter saccharivorans TaxID=265959 RepID=A0A347W9L1_9PROT|nr:hypothetical protein CD178_00747 [Komagataeibacter saccharivorans]